MTEQDRMDLALYGQILKGKGPWPIGPKSQAWRKRRQALHDHLYGKDTKCPAKGCPVCKPVQNIKI